MNNATITINMGQASTLTLCHELHALLLQRGVTRMNRPAWDSLIVRSAACSSATARVITTTGRDAGLWRTTHGSRAVEGVVEILPEVPPLAIPHLT